MAGAVHIPWYATGFRADRLAAALQQISPLAIEHGATDFAVYRSRDDAYRFLQIMYFEHKEDFGRFWYGDAFSSWRADYSGFYQIPVLYVWHDVVIGGSVETEAEQADAAAAPANPVLTGPS